MDKDIERLAADDTHHECTQVPTTQACIDEHGPLGADDEVHLGVVVVQDHV